MIGQTNSIWEINGQHEQLVNYTMIYDAGDECEEITGGLTHEGYDTNGVAAQSATRNTDNILVSYKTGHIAYMLGTTNTIDITGYTKFGAVGMRTNTSGSYGIRVFLQKEKTLATSTTRHFSLFYRDKNVKALKIVDVNRSDAYYIMFSADQSNGCEGYFYNAFLTKADDWQTLAQKAGITASSIDNILTNSTTLLSNKEAVEFMIYNCTGDFMVSAVANSTFLTALNNSIYKTRIWANEHWAKFLNMVA